MGINNQTNITGIPDSVGFEGVERNYLSNSSGYKVNLSCSSGWELQQSPLADTIIGKSFKMRHRYILFISKGQYLVHSLTSNKINLWIN